MAFFLADFPPSLRTHCGQNDRSCSSKDPRTPDRHGKPDDARRAPRAPRKRRCRWRQAARTLFVGVSLASGAAALGALSGCGSPLTLRDADLPPGEAERPRRILPMQMPARLPAQLPAQVPTQLPVLMPVPIPFQPSVPLLLPLPLPLPLPARVYEYPERPWQPRQSPPVEALELNRLRLVEVSGQPVTLTPVQRGRKETPSGHFVTLRLLEPMTSRWRVADEAADAAASPDDLRVEVRLFPKALPRWRLVGSSALNATGDSTWIEFTQAKIDQVLKLKVDCRWANGLEVAAVAHFQPAPDGPAAPLSMANRHKADQHLAQLEQQLAQQRQWLAARGAFPGGGPAGGGFTGGGFSAGGKSSASGKGAAAKLTEWRKMWEQQTKLAATVRERLDRLATLQQTLEQEGRLHIRLVRFSTGAEVPLVAVDPPV